MIQNDIRGVHLCTIILAYLATASFPANQARGDEVSQALKAIAEVGPQGAGSAKARQACDMLLKRDSEILPRLLNAMDTPNLVAANWYRTVYEEIARRELGKPSPQLPVTAMKEYVKNPRRQGRARRMVLRLLDDWEPRFGKQLLPRLLDDVEFRDDAVRLALAAGDTARVSKQVDQAKEQYRIAFTHARDARQITAAADRLAALDVNVSIVQQMGFVTCWYLLGPFDAPQTTGYDRRFPPEEEVDLSAVYQGKGDRQIGWKLHQTSDRMGLVNLIQAVAPVKEAVGFAYSELISKQDQDVELRCGADDNLTVWLNNEQVFTRRQWLNGTRLDRFTAPAKLRRGKNRVLVKVCQGPQHVNPAVPNNWSLQLRFCNTDGAAVKTTSALPSREDK